MSILHQNKYFNIFKKIIACFIMQAIISIPVLAINLDHTVDDEIRKNYNVDNGVTTKKEILPSLPSLPKNPSKSSPKKSYTTPSNPSKTVVAPKNQLPLRQGMVFSIQNVNTISDWQKANTNVVFTSVKPIKTAYYTIPEGTKFVGRIVSSHKPQLSGNGGLLSIEIINIIFGGQYQRIDARIIKIGDKKIFFEDIKGKRCYWKNTVDKGKWGRNTFHKMNGVSANLLQDKTTVILAPFTFLYGVVLGGVSTISSPVVSLFYKGSRIIIPANTVFKIKLAQDVTLYY